MPSPERCSSLIITGFNVKACVFKYSHAQRNGYEGLKIQAFTQKKPLNSGEKQHSRPDCCEHLKTQAFTHETPDNQKGRAIM